MKKMVMFISALSALIMCGCNSTQACKSTSCAKSTQDVSKCENSAKAQKSAYLKVASYNIQYAKTPTGRYWQSRKDGAKNLLAYHDFDIVGLQEIHPHQIDYFMPKHCAHIGMGMNSTSKDRIGSTPIMYRKDKVELLKWGVFWISETPEVMSKGWDTSQRRICTWGEFKDKASGKKLFYFNTHLDHRGKIARFEGIKLLMKKIPEIAGDTPFVLTGDFNIAIDSDPIKPMLESKEFVHALDASIKKPYYPNKGTFHGYTGIPKSFIDYLFVSPKIKVLSYAVLTDRIGNPNYDPTKSIKKQNVVDYPSDHFPVVSEISF